MKLSYKIFFGICIPTIIVSVLTSFLVIKKSTEGAIENENSLIIKNMESLESRAKFAIENQSTISVNENAYKGKEVKIYFLNNNEFKYKTDNSFVNLAKDVSSTANNNYSLRQMRINDKRYSVATTKIDANNSFVFIENVDFIYATQKDMIKNTIVIIVGMIVLVAIIASFISKTLTKPLIKIQKEMDKLSKGNFKINLKEDSSEFGKLASEFNKMSKELDKRNDSLMELINSKQMFIDNLAHEMNTPLTSIQGYAELMQKANLDEERKNKYLEYIQSESKRILDMYKKLLLLSYKKNSNLDIKRISVNNIFGEVQKTLSNKLEEKNIKLEINNHIDYMMGDETLIIICVLNLVKNAISVSNENSSIIIEAFKQDNINHIHVIDNGKGISKEDIAKITEPFYRVDKVRSRKDGGAGLGLSICKSIVEMHNGSMKIESTLGKGSIFMLEFME